MYTVQLNSGLGAVGVSGVLCGPGMQLYTCIGGGVVSCILVAMWNDVLRGSLSLKSPADCSACDTANSQPAIAIAFLHH